MTLKKKNSLLIGIIAIAAVASAAMVGFDLYTADADDVNKGIGKTEVWEPGPTDGPNNRDNDRQGDANLYQEYRELDKPEFAVSDLSNQELRDELQKLEQSGIPISTQLIDYDLKRIVLYSPDLTIGDEIAAILGDTPFVLLWEEAPPRWETGDPGEEIAELDVQSFLLPSAYAEGTPGTKTWFGAKLTNNANADGVYSRMEVHDTGIVIDTGNTLTAPGMSISDEGRLEVVIKYKPSTNPTLSIWDHYANPERYIHNQSLDSTFMSKYANTVLGSDFLYLKVEENSGDWEVYAYDFDDFHYDLLLSRTGGVGDLSYGWSIWEAHNFDESAGDCDDTTLLEIQNADIQVRNSGTWSYATSSHASNFFNTPLDCGTGSWNTNYQDWDVS